MRTEQEIKEEVKTLEASLDEMGHPVEWHESEPWETEARLKALLWVLEEADASGRTIIPMEG